MPRAPHKGSQQSVGCTALFMAFPGFWPAKLRGRPLSRIAKVMQKYELRNPPLWLENREHKRLVKPVLKHFSPISLRSRHLRHELTTCAVTRLRKSDTSGPELRFNPFDGEADCLIWLPQTSTGRLCIVQCCDIRPSTCREFKLHLKPSHHQQFEPRREWLQKSTPSKRLEPCSCALH